MAAREGILGFFYPLPGPSLPDSPKIQYDLWPFGIMWQQPLRCHGYVPPGTCSQLLATAGVFVRLRITVHALGAPGRLVVGQPSAAVCARSAQPAHDRPVNACPFRPPSCLYFSPAPSCCCCCCPLQIPSLALPSRPAFCCCLPLPDGTQSSPDTPPKADGCA